MKLSKKVYAYYITIVTNKAWLEHSTGLVRYTARWYCLAFYFPATCIIFFINSAIEKKCQCVDRQPMHEN